MISGGYRPGPADQRTIEERVDMLVYTSAPCEEPVEVTGPVQVILYVATDAPDTDFAARLVDVYPDGRAITITDGITRLSGSRGAGLPPLLQAGEWHQVTIDLWAVSIVFLPGHSIRLDITSSSFPRWERNLNTGANSGTTVKMRIAKQTVFHDTDHPSCVILPVVVQ